MHYAGMGVPQDLALAAHYYALARGANAHAQAMWEKLTAGDSGAAAPAAAAAEPAVAGPEASPVRERTGWRGKLSRWWND